jgi:chemotaxis protein CheZ
VAAVAKGHVMNFITDVEQATQEIDVNLTNIMMAQDFHDLTGQVVAKVVSLVSDVEAELVQLLISDRAIRRISGRTGRATPVSLAEPILHEPILQGPVVNPEGNPDVVKGQSEVDDLLASLGF